jgi:predicted MFS family arabinose efflux permease
MSRQTKEQHLATIVLITLVGCLISMINSGVRINYGLIATAIENHTGIAAASVSFAVAIAQLFYGFAQPVFGALALKKRNNSFVLIVGALMLLAGFILIPLCKSAALLDVALGVLVGGGTGAMAFGIVMGAVTPILGEKRAAAVSGIINGAGGIGGSILSPVTQALKDAGGLRAIMTCYAALAAVIAVICVWLLTKERAVEKGDAEEKDEPPVLKQVGEAIRSREFLHAALAFFTCGFFMAIIETQLYPQLLSLGLSGTVVALGFTIYGIFGMLGPVISGFLCIRMRCKWVVGTCYALRPVAVLLFFLMKPSVFSAYFFMIFLGLIGNSTVPPTSNLINKLYGVRKVGLLLGTAFVFHQIGSFISTWLGGILGANGQYQLLWILGSALAAGAAILCYTIKEPE